MEIGVFIPIGSNGWLVSTTSPQYKPTFELNRETTLNAERYGLDFVLSMIKLRGFGGKSEFWDHNLESFTLMAGLAAITERIKLFATVPTLAMPPAICARMVSTIDSISNGRFGLNVITGWQIPEYAQMGLWPGDDYFGHRYTYAAEYVTILRELWETGRSDFKGRFFTMNDCRLSPRPQKPVKLIPAPGRATRVSPSPPSTPITISASARGRTRRLPRREFGRAPCRLRPGEDHAAQWHDSMPWFMIVTAGTDAEAEAEKWTLYKQGADLEAPGLDGQAGHRRHARGQRAAACTTRSTSPRWSTLNIGLLLGSHIPRIAGSRCSTRSRPFPGLARRCCSTFDEFVVRHPRPSAGASSP